MDITEIIAHQHAEQRRMFAMLEEWPRADDQGLGAVWKRLAILLETHAEAEEKYFYPEVLRLGTGSADAESVKEEVTDAIKDHNEIRKAIRKVGRCKTGSAAWWTAVTDANVYNSKHMGEEERQDLADFRQQSTLELRHEIAVAFIRYESTTAARGIKPTDKAPKRYVATREGATKSAIAERAARKKAAPTKKAASKKASAEASASD
ncbi:MAG: hemerythrin domain-containing protein [Nostocoides sp.]